MDTLPWRRTSATHSAPRPIQPAGSGVCSHRRGCVSARSARGLNWFRRAAASSRRSGPIRARVELVLRLLHAWNAEGPLASKSTLGKRPNVSGRFRTFQTVSEPSAAVANAAKKHPRNVPAGYPRFSARRFVGQPRQRGGGTGAARARPVPMFRRSWASLTIPTIREAATPRTRRSGWWPRRTRTAGIPSAGRSRPSRAARWR